MVNKFVNKDCVTNAQTPYPTKAKYIPKIPPSVTDIKVILAWILKFNSIVNWVLWTMEIEDIIRFRPA